MDFGLRELLFFIGLLFIVGILIDGLRRMRKSRGDLFGLPPDYDQIDLGHRRPTSSQDQLSQTNTTADVISLNTNALNTNASQAPLEKGQGAREMGEELYNDELPNGGARPVRTQASGDRGGDGGGDDESHSLTSPVDNSSKSNPSDHQKTDQTLAGTVSESVSGSVSADASEAAGVAKAAAKTEKSASPEQRTQTAAEATQSPFSSWGNERSSFQSSHSSHASQSSKERGQPQERRVASKTSAKRRLKASTTAQAAEQASNRSSMNQRRKERRGRDAYRSVHQEPSFEEEISVGVEKEVAEKEVRASDDASVSINTAIEDVIIFNIVAKNRGTFSGQSLLKATEMCGMELGKMNIFHQYERGTNDKLFSMANLVEPGTFELDKIHDFKTPGVCLFMQLPGPQRSIVALELMVDTARKLAIKLGAEMRDDHHSVITPQTIEHYRQRVMEYERKRRTRRHVEAAH